MNISLEKESIIEGGINLQWWIISENLHVLIVTLLRPAIYVNYKDFDILHLLLKLGFEKYINIKNINLKLSHGKSHHCFKVEKEDVNKFLGELKIFFEQFKDEVELKLQENMNDRTWVRDWKNSWWYEYKENH